MFPLECSVVQVRNHCNFGWKVAMGVVCMGQMEELLRTQKYLDLEMDRVLGGVERKEVSEKVLGCIPVKLHQEPPEVAPPLPSAASTP